MLRIEIMYKFFKNYIFSVIFYLFLIFPDLCIQGEEETSASNNIVAIVAGNPVTKDQVFDLLMERYPAQAQEIITELILYQIVKLEAKQEKISFSSHFLEKKASEEIEKIKKDIEKNRKQSWQDYLIQAGVSEEKFFSDTVRKLRYKIALQSLIRLSEMKEVQIDARHIMLASKEKAQEILTKLRSNADFEALVQKESLSATKNQGGMFPKLFQGDIDPSLEKVLFSLKPMKISDVVQSPWGYHILQVIRVYPSKPDASWTQDRIEILDSLEKNPVSDRSLKRWLEKMGKKYSIMQKF
ncbi:MAG: peptidylprolyl isomerase [Candidatus Brocadiae bacterium]|nr:peptidylprolyl isomerase [Candidatus Brocadiia bacterium]